MSKHILLLIILIQLNICIRKDVSTAFVVNPNLKSQKEITIEEGKVFCIKILSSGKNYFILNQKENEDALEFQGSEKIEEDDDDEQEHHGKGKSYILYYLKAKAATEKPKSLKFGDGFSCLKQKRSTRKNIITPEITLKINITK